MFDLFSEHEIGEASIEPPKSMIAGDDIHSHPHSTRIGSRMSIERSRYIAASTLAERPTNGYTLGNNAPDVLRTSGDRIPIVNLAHDNFACEWDPKSFPPPRVRVISPCAVYPSTCPLGVARDTYGCPSRKNRHSRSTAFEIPIRDEVSMRSVSRRGPSEK